MRWSLGAGVAVVAAGRGRAPGGARHADMSVKLEEVASGLTAPMMMVQPAGDDRRFIIEQNGRVSILTADGEVLDEPFLDLTDQINPHRRSSTRRACSASPSTRTSPATASSTSPTRPYLNGDGDPAKQLWWAHTNVVAETRSRRTIRTRPIATTERIRSGDRLAAVQPQRPLDRLRSGRHAVHLDRRRRLRQRLGHRPQRRRPATARTDRRCTARCCASTSTARPRAITRVPKDNPFVGNSNDAPEIWAYRLAQPVALLVRHGRRPRSCSAVTCSRTASRRSTSSSRAATTAGAAWRRPTASTS